MCSLPLRLAAPLAIGPFANILAPRLTLNFILTLGPTLAAVLVLIFVRTRLVWMAGVAILFGFANYAGAAIFGSQQGHVYNDVCRDQRQYFETLIAADRSERLCAHRCRRQ